ncbi:MAG: NUDIX hydrolase [Burkholderiales bacterium]|nr:MAG: NUDIX hydrolase [Burkholderiales bacterium]
MDLNLQTVTTPPRAAATVVMLRDGMAGLEVFLLKRSGLADVLGGAYVFPGGKVDASDAALDMPSHLDAEPAVLLARLNEPDIDELTGASLYIAALREAFEEAGVLYAENCTAAMAERAWSLIGEGRTFAEVLLLMNLRLQATSLVPWTRWITPTMPSVMNRRFDTRFFVAGVPGDQVAVHNDHESTESTWLRPRAALEQYRDGVIELAPPQIMSLAHLSRHASVDSVLAEASGRMPPVIQPEPFDADGVRTICYPGDERHSRRERAMPGPSRLSYVGKRFTPPGGFDTLFD